MGRGRRHLQGSSPHVETRRVGQRAPWQSISLAAVLPMSPPAASAFSRGSPTTPEQAA